MTPQLIVFDFDGVLVDSEILSNRVLASVLSELGYPMTPAESHRRFTGLNVRTVREAVERDRGRPLSSEFEAMVREQAHRRIETELRMVAGADILLRGLSGPRCIASNSGPLWIDLALEATGLDTFFLPEHRFSAAQVAKGKPAPDLFVHAATAMGIDPTACIVIEDSIHGVRGARTAGMRVLGFTGASHIEEGHDAVLREAGVEAVFDDLTQLPEILRRL
jgi:HAD superfamily hydrolase (TIGR01509 family)